jgi:hypothetical protein
LTIVSSSFTVFDYTKKGRKSYYHPTATNTSMSTGATLAPASSPLDRAASPGEKTQYCSTTGLDIEAQIADGGGLAAMRASGADTVPTTAAQTPMLSPMPTPGSIMPDRKSPDIQAIPLATLVSGSWEQGGCMQHQF